MDCEALGGIVQGLRGETIDNGVFAGLYLKNSAHRGPFMEERDLKVIEELLPHNEELRRLMEEHESFKRQLRAFQEKRYLTPEEEMEKKRIQKLKLAGKDRIEAILSAHRKKLTEKEL